MGNAWMDHVAKVWAKNKGKKSYKQTLVDAKKTYKSKTTKVTKKKAKAKQSKSIDSSYSDGDE